MWIFGFDRAHTLAGTDDLAGRGGDFKYSASVLIDDLALCSEILFVSGNRPFDFLDLQCCSRIGLQLLLIDLLRLDLQVSQLRLEICDKIQLLLEGFLCPKLLQLTFVYLQFEIGNLNLVVDVVLPGVQGGVVGNDAVFPQ